MPLSLKHKYVSPRPDTSDPTVVQSSNWNDEHDLITDGLTLLGRDDPTAGTVEVLTPAQARTVLDVDNLFAPIVHDHDDLYYTEGEVDTFLAAKEEILLQPYSYENRGNVRSVDGYGDNKVFIESLGMFRWVAGSTEIDDDETCFSTATGAWLLEAAAWDFVFANWYPEIDNISSRLSDVETTIGPVGTDIPTQIGQSGRFLTTNGVDLLWADVQQASGSSVNGTLGRQTYTATAAQTTFAVAYDVGFVDVWLNGVKLLAGTDFTATNGTSIVLASGATAGDIIDIIAFGAFSVADVVPQSRQVIAGNGLSGGGNLSTDVTLSVIEVPTPTNVSPANAATDITETPTLEGSAYLSLYGKTQKSSQWQISTVADFASTVYDSGEILGVGVTHVVPAGNLSTSQLYYWRTRYRDTDDVFSAYSTGTTFTTAASFNDFVATPSAVPAIGASHEGGFYFGQIWDERTTSATSTAIGTGSKTFTVTDAAPLFYSGQAIKIVSRADAGGRVMEGTVTGSSGTTLTVNVTSVTGSGTYTDWSVLVKYRLIVAPKSSGDNASVAFKNANTAAPVATQTLTNGPAATAAMVAADTSTVYPLAHWADGLSIGGFSDWYAPARDELELIWRNLKPVTNNNDTSDRPKSAIAYTTGGNADDLSADTHGVNRHSDPAGVAYTAGVPAQTSVAAFQSGGAEALEFGSAVYWSSSESSSSNAWKQYYTTSFPGYQFSNDKTNAHRARAVRRSIV